MLIYTARQMKAYVEPEWSTVNHKLDELDLEEKREKEKSKKQKQPIEKGDDDESDAELNEGELNESENVEEKEEGDEYNEDDSDFDESLFCVACNKTFKSSKSFQNHEKSKKHKENIELLKKHMKDEDRNLFFDKNDSSKPDELDEQEDDDENLDRNETTKQRFAYISDELKSQIVYFSLI